MLRPDDYLRPLRNGSKWMMIPVAIFGLQVGTGGYSTEHYLKARGEKGYAFFRSEGLEVANENRARSCVDMLIQIRTVLRPTMNHLASAIGVSRQAIYDWLSGSQIADEYTTPIYNLAQAADVFSQNGLQASNYLLLRKIYDGKNLFEIIRDGGNGEDAARILVTHVNKELAQRKIIESRLVGRKSRAVQLDEYGIPIMYE